MRLDSSIARVAGSFQVFVRKWLRLRVILSDSITVPAAASKSSSAAAAIVGNATARASARKLHDATRSAVPLDATSEARSVLATMLADSTAGGFADAG